MPIIIGITFVDWTTYLLSREAFFKAQSYCLDQTLLLNNSLLFSENSTTVIFTLQLFQLPDKI